MKHDLKAMRKHYQETVVRLEKDKLKIKKKLEKEMKRFAKLTRQPKLGHRHAAVGHAPNDWKDDDSVWRLLAD